MITPLFDVELFRAADEFRAVGAFAVLLDVVVDFSLEDRLHDLNRRWQMFPTPADQRLLVDYNDLGWFAAESDNAARKVKAAPIAVLLSQSQAHPVGQLAAEAVQEKL